MNQVCSKTTTYKLFQFAHECILRWMAQLERPTLDGSVRDTYFGWLWAPLSAVDCSPGRRSLFVYLEGQVVFIEKKLVK